MKSIIVYFTAYYFLVVLAFIFIGRRFADFYVKRTGKEDEWRAAFCATGLVAIIIHTISSAVMAYLLTKESLI